MNFEAIGNVFADYCYYWLIVLAIIVLIIYFSTRKKKKSGKTCKHEWKAVGHIVLNEKYPRVVSVCDKCGVYIHLPILTQMQLKIREMKKEME